MKIYILTTIKKKEGILNIFNYINSLKYEYKPNYKSIYDQIFQLRLKELKGISYNYEYNCLMRNSHFLPNFYQSFLNWKFEWDNDNIYQFAKFNNNITINNPTQNQIIMFIININSFQENNNNININNKNMIEAVYEKK